MSMNAVGRHLPDAIPGYGPVKPFQGAAARVPEGHRDGGRLRAVYGGKDKVLPDLKAAIAWLDKRKPAWAD